MLEYLGGPSVITIVLERVQEEGCRGWSDGNCWKATMRQGKGWALEAQKDKERGSPLEPPEGAQPC